MNTENSSNENRVSPSERRYDRMKKSRAAKRLRKTLILVGGLVLIAAAAVIVSVLMLTSDHTGRNKKTANSSSEETTGTQENSLPDQSSETEAASQESAESQETSEAGPVFQDMDGFRYLVRADGSYVTGLYEAEDGTKYVFTDDGKEYINCIGAADGNYYYCDENGIVLCNETVTLADGNTVMSGEDGMLYTGCVLIGDTVYDFTTHGLLRRTVDATKPMVALTYDDGPSTSNTEPILEILTECGGADTFFVCGRNVERCSDIILAIENQGSEIGNHTFNHYMLSCLDMEAGTGEISSTSSYVEEITLNRPSIVRPPTGSLNESALELARSVDSGYPLIMWSIDTVDWSHHDAATSCQTIREQVRDGSIILMHDMDNPSSVEATRTIAPELTAAGYQLVTVSEMAAARGGMEPGGVYYHFYPDDPAGSQWTGQ